MTLIEEYCSLYMEKVFYFCLRKTGRADEAETLASDIGYDIIRALNNGNIPVNFSAWVWKIARNRFAKWVSEKCVVRYREAIDFDELDEIVGDNECIEDELIKSEQLKLLRRELGFIRDDYRKILVAHYIECKSVAVIADELAVPLGTVKTRLQNSRKKLREGMNMAREFGLRSYNPDNVAFSMCGMTDHWGKPWSVITRLISKNILLETYRNPSDTEQLSMELGISLPYMEDELSNLVSSTLLKKNGNLYETDFIIVSKEAQAKIFERLAEITPELTKFFTELIELQTQIVDKSQPSWHKGFQPYEDMKWTLLMMCIDEININLSHELKKNLDYDKSELGDWGYTKRPGDVQWDLLGLEVYDGIKPNFVGLHGAQQNSNPVEKVDFGQFKFNYNNISSQTPDLLDYSLALTLKRLVEGKNQDINAENLKKLEEIGYVKKTDNGYIPNILVFDKEMLSNNTYDTTLYDELYNKISEMVKEYYLFCYNVISSELPTHMAKNTHQLHFACDSILQIRGAVLEEALRIGYISYNPDEPKRMLGSHMYI
ncbi:MAG: sigma-70 family RNA polymerase sigma factor [Eubacteriales bacterium]|nr:sigma-70 family RNA polymerase sigma factor [Eubacteriales bacterium]MDD4476173.1 sigma-70 family RNA polymerase sigma factor [Eubacteriales bacterium]